MPKLADGPASQTTHFDPIKHFTNREGQIEAFKRLLEKDSPWVLFLHGMSGYGKSTLIRYLIKEYCEPSNIPYAELPLNLPNVCGNGFVMLDRLAHGLRSYVPGSYDDFVRQCDSIRHELDGKREGLTITQNVIAHAGAYISGVQQDAKIGLAHEADIDKYQRLAEAFMVLIKKLPQPAVFFIDTYELLERADDRTLIGWLWNMVLERAHWICPGLRVVIGSQDPPNKLPLAYEIALFSAIGDQVGQGKTLQSIGDVYQLTNDNKDAIISYKKALQHFNAADDRIGIGSTLLATGYAWQQSKRGLSDAIICYIKATQVFREIGDRFDEVKTLRILGDAHYENNDKNTAMKSYKDALQIYYKLDDHLGQALTFQAMGNLYYHKHDFNRTIKYYEKSHRLFRRIRFHSGESETRKVLGELQQLKKHIDTAIKYCKGIIIRIRAVDNRLGDANLLLILGWLYHERGNLKQAGFAFALAIVNHSFSGNQYSIVVDLYYLSCLQETLGKTEAAVDSLEMAVKICFKLNLSQPNSIIERLLQLLNISDKQEEVDYLKELEEKSDEVDDYDFLRAFAQ